MEILERGLPPGIVEYAPECALRPKTHQIRLIAIALRPVSSAINVVDQCAAFFGFFCNVLSITSAHARTSCALSFTATGRVRRRN